MLRKTTEAAPQVPAYNTPFEQIRGAGESVFTAERSEMLKILQSKGAGRKDSFRHKLPAAIYYP